MKLIMILLTTAIMQVSANSFAQRITLNETNTSLEKVIEKIRKQSGYDFVYNDYDLSGTLNVTIHINNVELERSLKLCLAGKDLDYEIKERTIIIKKKETTLLNAISQMILPTGPIKGSVIDADGVGLPGAIIRDKKTLKSLAVTNANGEFAINVEDGTVVLVSFIGYKPQEVVIKKGMKNLIISLENNVSKLDVVSVEGYRKGSRRLTTSDVSQITAEELEKQPVQNPLQALEGRIPGLVVSQVDGVPGARLNLQIRGRANFDKNLTSDQPLFIMDGVPIAAGNDKINLQSGPFGPATQNGLSAFAGINMADIESIDVLKDADATAIYGSRGANGVILITTKKGKAGKMVINANIYSGISTVTSLTPLLNTQEYLAMRNEAFANDKLTKTNANAYDLLIWDPNRYTDFEKLLVGNNAHTTDAQVTASGGTKYNQYRIGGGYHKETTVWPGDKSSDRASLNFNLNSMSDNEKFTSTISGNYSIGNSTLTAIDLANAVILPPNYRLYDANGNIAWNEGNFSDGKDNPLSQLNQQYLAQTNNLNANLTLNYKLLKNVVVRSSMGYNSTINNERRITPITSRNPLTANLSGIMGVGNNVFKNWIIEPQAEYNGYIKKGKLNILVGATYNQRNTNSESANATGATSDDLAGSFKAYTTFTAANTLTQYNYQAFFGRINYNWEDKYIVNFTGRRDGSSRFGPNYRFSNFGAIGAAWLFSNEGLLKNNKILSYGKLRASYGTTGNDQIGEYSYLDSWAGNSTYNDSTTLSATKLYNPNLHWERNDKAEIGIELGFFKDRILLSASIYQNISSDPLVSYPLPRTTGFASIVENLNGVEVQNRGLEMTLSTQNFTGKNFSWSTDFNLTVPQNILKKFPNLSTSSYATTYAIGESINRIFAGQYVGVDPTTGLYTAKDVDGDGKVTAANDYATAGTSDPKFYGGINNSFSYKRFSLSFFFQFTNQIGKDWRSTGATLMPAGTANNVPTLVLSRWQNPGDVSTVQRFTTSTGTLQGTSGYYAGYFSNLIYSDASFLRLKNVAMSYTIPPRLLSAIHINSFRIYMQAQNLFVITPYKGADPETQSFTLMPPLRTVTLGLQLTL